MSIGAPSRLSTTPLPRQRLPGLDLIRAVAISWVMVYHASIMGLVPSPDHWIFAFGWMGVDLFFVLSGYLIASQLLQPFSLGRRPAYRAFSQGACCASCRPVVRSSCCIFWSRRSVKG